MNPSIFNTLVEYLESQEVIHNSSSNEQQQMPIDRQILLTLLQMKCYSNGTSLYKIATIVGLGHDTLNCVYCYIIMALQRNNLCIEYMKKPKREAKEVTKQWVVH